MDLAHNQQVNNALPTASEVEGGPENANVQTKQSGGSDELLSDARAPSIAGQAGPPMETVGKTDRAKVRSG